MEEEKNTTLKVKIGDLSPHLTCGLCRGYYRDARTAKECLHTFCLGTSVTVRRALPRSFGGRGVLLPGARLKE